MTWNTFVRAHWPALSAADFFTTEVWTMRGLVTYYTAFVIELHSRRVYALGTTPHPDEAFVIQTPAAGYGFWHGPRTRRSHPDLRSGPEVESSGRAVADDGRHSHRPDTRECSQLQHGRRTIRAVEQGGVLEPDRAVR